MSEQIPAIDEILNLTAPLGSAESAFLAAYEAWVGGSGAAVDDPQVLYEADLARHMDRLSGPLAEIGRVAFSLTHRDAYVARFGYCAPTAEFVRRLTSLGPILEVGAGLGVLSHLIRKGGGIARATDLAPWPAGHDVERMSAAEAISSFPDCTVLCSWPSLGEDWLADAIDSMQPGRILALVSEGAGGAAGSDALFEKLHADFDTAPTDPTTTWSWPHIHDGLSLWRRR